MEWYRIKKAPLVLGHEITGEVVEVGEGVKDFQPGERVFASHHVPCGKCRYCLAGHQSVCDMLRTTHFDPGGFAELIRVPKINVELGTFLLPDESHLRRRFIYRAFGVRSPGAALRAFSRRPNRIGDR